MPQRMKRQGGAPALAEAGDEAMDAADQAQKDARDGHGEVRAKLAVQDALVEENHKADHAEDRAHGAEHESPHSPDRGVRNAGCHQGPRDVDCEEGASDGNEEAGGLGRLARLTGIHLQCVYPSEDHEGGRDGHGHDVYDEARGGRGRVVGEGAQTHSTHHEAIRSRDGRVGPPYEWRAGSDEADRAERVDGLELQACVPDWEDVVPASVVVDEALGRAGGRLRPGLARLRRRGGARGRH
mmetsp:Transcript_52673/g.170073  ORF Transcript_52673/g.170073 Transcript_52673/m.170073 type:complete len:240 (-) Transcript_52673:85-804(-)